MHSVFLRPVSYLASVALAPLDVNPRDDRFRLWILIILAGLAEGVFRLLIYLFDGPDLPQNTFEVNSLKVACLLPAFGLFIPGLKDKIGIRAHSYFWFAAWTIAIPLLHGLLYASLNWPVLRMAAVVGSVFIFYQLMDWRFASAGLLISVLLVWVVTHLGLISPTKPLPAEHIVMILMATCASMLLAISSASMRIEKMNASLESIGILAHEFRTPLASANLLTSVVEESVQYLLNDHIKSGRGPKSEEEAESLIRISEASALLKDVVRFLNAQVDTQMLNAKSKVSDFLILGDVIKEVGDAVHEFERIQPQVKGNIILDFPEGAEGDLEDTNRLQFRYAPDVFPSAITNLLSNSVKAVIRRYQEVPVGSISVLVKRISGRRGILIQVQDQGDGISAKNLPSIFDPFFTTSETPAHGLGLTMVNRVVKKMKGRIVVSSVVGSHTIVSLYFPLADSKDAPSTSYNNALI